MSASCSSLKRLMPTMVWAPLSMRAWVRAAASSMRILGRPVSMALAMPPSSWTSSMSFQALAASSSVRLSTKLEPPQGSMKRVVPDSFWR